MTMMKIVRVGKNSGPVLSHLLTTVHEILGQCRRPFVLPKALARLSMSRYSPLSLEVGEKLNKCKVFWPPIFSGGTTATSLQQIVSAIYCPPFGIIWLNSVCWSVCEAWQWSRKQNLRRVGKSAGPILSCLWTEVHVVLRRYRIPLLVANTLARLFISCFIPKIEAVKVTFKL